jgi:hypothetical protein
MAAQLDNQLVAVVLRGTFTPPIFQPAWFASHGLIRAQESDAANVQIIVPEASIFTAEWLQLNVIQNRFQVATTQESFYEPLRDLVVGVLKILNETPLRGMGINRSFHYRLASEDAWHRIGNQLAPKDTWGALLDKPGMRSLIMHGARTDRQEGYIQVKVEPEPADKIKFGVHVEFNDHYQFKPTDPNLMNIQRATEILSQCWKVSMERGMSIASKIADIGDQA